MQTLLTPGSSPKIKTRSVHWVLRLFGLFFGAVQMILPWNIYINVATRPWHKGQLSQMFWLWGLLSITDSAQGDANEKLSGKDQTF